MRKNTNKLDKKSVDDILHTLRHHLPELQEQYGVRSLWLFGSYVRGEERKRSDLLKIKVDLVEKDILKPDIGRNVLKEIVQV